ncbi:armadillo repeat-containing protein 10 [Chanos chanos]|uniref:Armadillo repeat-containing protein 10 n=1 Tax=Chanos chanos TaxID=29144 RepID=A0A6J2WAA3_CHACN|nr:armadillo repeat-containing protein 10 [Chanos chanos]
MGDDGVVPRLGNMKALLGLIAGAGASYGLYKLVRSGSKKSEISKRSIDRSSESGFESKPLSNMAIRPGSLLAKVSDMNIISGTETTRVTDTPPSDVLSKSPGSLEPRHIGMLLYLLQNTPNPSERRQVLLTLGNAAAFTVNQDLVRESGGLHVIAGFLPDPSPDVRVQTLNALNNLSMNVRNQEQLKIYVPQVLELIEMSPVNSEIQLAALRLLTNLSVTDIHQHLMKNATKLFLSLLVVSNEILQIQVLKVLVNLSSNPDMMDDIVQAQAPASLVLLFDCCTNTPVLLRLFTFIGNLRAWRPSAQVAEALRRRSDSLYCVLLDESSQLHSRLPALLSHPDSEVKAQVAKLLT